MDVMNDLMNKELCINQLDKVINEIRMMHRVSSINKFQMLLLALKYARRAVERERGISEARESLHNTIAFDVADWGNGKRKAWIYGIVVGWDKPSYEEFKVMYGWDDETIGRNIKLHELFNNL